MLARTDGRSRRRGIILLWGVWAVTRGLYAAALLKLVSFQLLKPAAGDVRLYRHWARVLAAGSFPADDPRWQYPPLAGAVMLLPRLSGRDYLATFVFLMVLVDALVLVLLLRAGGSPAGAWTWVAGMFLLGPFCYARYDLVVVLAAVAALLALPRMGTFGTLTGVGAMLKVWPVFLLLGLPRGRGGVRALTAFAAAAGAGLAAAAALGGGGWGFLAGQQGRGLQMESVAATPFHVARVLGWMGVTTRPRYGSRELVGTGVPAAATVCLTLTVVALAVIAVIARRRPAADWDPVFACDVALAVTLAAVVTSRVLSPQYLSWLLGVGAVCLTRVSTRQRAAVALILAAALLSHVEFPLLWKSIAKGYPAGVGVLAARNLLLVAATVLAILRLRGGPCPRPAGTPGPRFRPDGKIATFPER
ncbi:glycosyltransferase 87 family protein [Actinomadura scrupuli]|uniref:glycosyltransferase 87 family protein n=1 Tax=Actinomadura scrupuli TaxID=559629 RepID=UPI003D9811B6